MSKWALLALILVTGLAADQATKFMAVDRLTTALTVAGPALGDRVKAFLAVRHLEGYATDPYVVYGPLWRMRYAENPGAAWGFLRNLSADARLLLFGVITLAATVAILLYVRRLEAGQRLHQVALSLVLTGAWGNYLDRLTHGYVVDFIDWHWWNRPDLYWPTFNVADSLIVVGVGLLLLFPGPKQDAPARRE
jgi:signal peptidase II